MRIEVDAEEAFQIMEGLEMLLGGTLPNEEMIEDYIKDSEKKKEYLETRRVLQERIDKWERRWQKLGELEDA